MNEHRFKEIPNNAYSSLDLESLQRNDCKPKQCSMNETEPSNQKDNSVISPNIIEIEDLEASYRQLNADSTTQVMKVGIQREQFSLLDLLQTTN